MNVLVIAPHPDDEAIGCGGSICRHVLRGDHVAVVFLTSGELGLKHLPCEEAWRIREAESRSAAKVLGVEEPVFLRGRDWYLSGEVDTMAARLEPVLRRLRPELVYVPHGDEWHPDHQAAPHITQAAIRRSAIRPPEVRMYEVWTPLPAYDHIEDISAVVETKRSAILQYRSQLEGFSYDRAILGLNQYRGLLGARCEFAEVFRSLEPADHDGEGQA